METVKSSVVFAFQSRKSQDRRAYSKRLTNIAKSIRNGQFSPSVIFVRTSGKCSPVRSSHSVIKRLLYKKKA